MSEFLEQKTNSAEKHKKYIDEYNSNGLYWGLGIENELYLEFENKKTVSKDFFIKNHKRERYSVNYYSNYKDFYCTHAFTNVSVSDLIELPVLINSHSFLYTDSKNNSQKLYTKLCEPNPKFLGKTLNDEIIEKNNYFKDSINNTWLYDGDTFEFTTLHFFNAKLKNVVDELQTIKNNFIQNLQEYQKDNNLFLDYGKIKFMDKNYPFALHLTNLNNIGIFNNGTLHYNLTLPTLLNKNKLIEDRKLFISEHKKAIKIIQYLEPLLIAVYNTPDFFSQDIKYTNSKMFSGCSQRCAVSRYIGIGTYDTDLMLEGKILTTSNSNYDNIKNWWYNKYHEGSAYNKLTEIGLDINFNKHYNHGIEIRFLDHISDKNLIYESFEFIIYLIDFTLDSVDIFDNPIYNEIWNGLVCNVMIYGKQYILSIDEINLYSKLFNYEFKQNNIKKLYYEIFDYLLVKFNEAKKINKIYYIIPKGTFSSLVLNNKEVTKEYVVQKGFTINKKSFFKKIIDHFSCIR